MLNNASILMLASGISSSMAEKGTFGERISAGLLTALLGYATCFVVLCLLLGVLVIFKIVFYDVPNKKKAAEAPETEAPAPVEAAPEPEEDDGELVAAITAAVSAYLDAENAGNAAIPATGFRVVSFRKNSK